ncbi:hypothetical protein COU61_02275 [Candidatus Pacearchaeota archaeon CG10_big_fil_rev_8_21_14_0_10_35_13]|nr:MAG: hypothetical protein COU61_02275 [Candidatus Pacearchaeota archaeon CG10_big_fil_rev_8_21_14_0_10_35_13]
MNNGILKYCFEKGCLIDKEVYEVLDKLGNTEVAKKIIESLTVQLNQKIITKTILGKYSRELQQITQSNEEKTTIERICINLGINIEITKKEQILIDQKNAEKVMEATKVEILEIKEEGIEIIKKGRVKVLNSHINKERKVTVPDFVKHFKIRYQMIKKMLQERPELENLTTINKLSMKRQNVSIIGMVLNKRITKNKNIIIEVEDPTGKINVLINSNKEEACKIAKQILLDDIIGIKATGDHTILFANEIYYPDAIVRDKVRLEEDESVAFISDIHVGSKLFLRENFEKFIKWLNGEVGEEEQKKEALKIKYLMIIGDNIDGVGVYPGQEKLLEMPDIRDQYKELARYLNMIRKDLTIMMIPGQHDSVRVAEPQPPIGKDYGEPLHEIDNLLLLSNPCTVEIGGNTEGGKGIKILMYHGASFAGIINEIEDLRLGRAFDTPTKVVKHLLKRRHLSPTHSFTPYIPNETRDPMVIEHTPDIVATGDLHKSDIDTYNNILLITGGCWQSTTPFEEKVGNHPDPCKVPIYNLKTRALKIIDFS